MPAPHGIIFFIHHGGGGRGHGPRPRRGPRPRPPPRSRLCPRRTRPLPSCPPGPPPGPPPATPSLSASYHPMRSPACIDSQQMHLHNTSYDAYRPAAPAAPEGRMPRPEQDQHRMRRRQPGLTTLHVQHDNI